MGKWMFKDGAVLNKTSSNNRPDHKAALLSESRIVIQTLEQLSASNVATDEEPADGDGNAQIMVSLWIRQLRITFAW